MEDLEIINGVKNENENTYSEHYRVLVNEYKSLLHKSLTHNDLKFLSLSNAPKS